MQHHSFVANNILELGVFLHALLTLGAHAQRGLWSVCVCVSVSASILAQQATRRPMSDTNVFSRPANPPGISGFIPEKRCFTLCPAYWSKTPGFSALRVLHTPMHYRYLLPRGAKRYDVING